MGHTLEDYKQGPVLSIKQGQIKGVIEENMVDGVEYFVFRGIPYAKPPIGKLRFKDPLPPEEWFGIRDCSKFGNVCAQMDAMINTIIGSDDCLYLNVYTPRIDFNAKLAVMVWIHGGGFYMGSGNDDLYKPVYIIRKDVIVVTINYRLGPLGFLNLEDEVAPGNQGMKDTVMALRWVRDNIAVFGGDPENVTIFGESAGGAIVHYLTMSPMADGLFHKAIAQSGVATNFWAFALEEPRRYAYQLSIMLGFKSFDPKAIVEFLQKVDLEKLVKYQFKILTNTEKNTIFTPFLPGVDNKSKNPFLLQPPSIAMKYGVKVPFLFGFNNNEGSFIWASNEYTNRIAEKEERINYDFENSLSPPVLDLLKKKNLTVNEFKSLYFNEKSFDDQPIENLIQFKSDYYFLHHIFEIAHVMPIVNNCPSYFYKFSYDSEEKTFIKTILNIDIPGATHSDELYYFFYGTLYSLLHLQPHCPGTPNYKIMERVTQLWTDFAKTGNPTPKTTELVPVLWKPLEKNSKTYDYLNINEQLQMESIPKGVQRFEWNPKMNNKL
ncbi:juvenile hormone esterase-like [Polistes fuscatus]|uniref:juvenile hormone esterase-like n=1 Tax=Polistes fuscatus TaxID=30207 RepID=UPI001CA89EE3|nr:juvenile hormone esterase-like [Polistes fuscatus]XP_043488516.1 juvenile hormone esterase-like [Polistes fuscatus]